MEPGQVRRTSWLRSALEISSLAAGLMFALTAFGLEVIFEIHGLNFLAVATVEDVVLDGLYVLAAFIACFLVLTPAVLVTSLILIAVDAIGSRTGSKIAPKATLKSKLKSFLQSSRYSLPLGAAAAAVVALVMSGFGVSASLENGVGRVVNADKILAPFKCKTASVIWVGTENAWIDCDGTPLMLKKPEGFLVSGGPQQRLRTRSFDAPPPKP